jgi:hypothetical protein
VLRPCLRQLPHCLDKPLFRVVAAEFAGGLLKALGLTRCLAASAAKLNAVPWNFMVGVG